jgi:hypothetical protein
LTGEKKNEGVTSRNLGVKEFKICSVKIVSKISKPGVVKTRESTVGDSVLRTRQRNLQVAVGGC